MLETKPTKSAESKVLLEELAPYRQWLTGRILNAGCGRRYIDLGEHAFRLDFVPEFATNVDVVADVHKLPFGDSTFDSVLSVAVLEHTRFAWEVAREFYRVLRPGGVAVVGIPFMQPRHAVPDDYVRFTDAGIRALMEWADFDVLGVYPAHPAGFNLEWMVRELLIEYPLVNKALWPLRRYLLPRARQGKVLNKYIGNLQSAHYVVAQRPDAL